MAREAVVVTDITVDTMEGITGEIIIGIMEGDRVGDLVGIEAMWVFTTDLAILVIAVMTMGITGITQGIALG